LPEREKKSKMPIRTDKVVDFEEEEEMSTDLHNPSPRDTITSFIGFWVDGDYKVAYDLLTQDSPLREGLSREKWAERREVWADKFEPGDLEPNFIYEREPQKAKLRLPFSKGPTVAQREVVVGWSLELEEKPVNDPLPELPEATVIYEETGRGWFWASFTLTQENDEWHIQSITDECKKAQSLSSEDLTRRIQELDEALEKFAQKHTPEEINKLDEASLQSLMANLITQAMEATCYTDVLLKKVPFDRSIYEEAAARVFVFGQYERCLVYMLPLAQRLLEDHAVVLSRIGQVYQKLSEQYFEKTYDERGDFYRELAEKTLRESLGIEAYVETHLALAELLIAEGKRLDEAEGQLAQARELSQGSEDEARIELFLGEIATARNQYEQALSHYQRVVELLPDSAESWFDVGEAHRMLGNFEDAATSYKRAIELEPANEDYYYSSLALMYRQNGQSSQAVETLEKGLQANPDSAELHAARAIMYVESGNNSQAKISLEKAESLNPASELVQMVRQRLDESRSGQAAPTKKPKKGSGKKRGSPRR
jgi:tetratricopeptide (TPR) repeat protein